jgi:hypothetical protein
MNIKPSSPDTVSPNPLPPTKKPESASQHALHEFLMEEFQPSQFRKIAEAWKNNPEVRPEVLDAAKALASDPNYPTPAQLAQLAKMIVGKEVPPQVEPPVPAPTPDIEPPVS